MNKVDFCGVPGFRELHDQDPGDQHHDERGIGDHHEEVGEGRVRHERDIIRDPPGDQDRGKEHRGVQPGPGRDPCPLCKSFYPKKRIDFLFSADPGRVVRADGKR